MSARTALVITLPVPHSVHIQRFWESRASPREDQEMDPLRRNSRETLPGLPASDSHAKTLKVTAPPSQVITQQTKGWRHPGSPVRGTVTLPKQGHRSRSSRGPGGPRQ